MIVSLREAWTTEQDPVLPAPKIIVMKEKLSLGVKVGKNISVI
jgi:hypothetical protein